MIDSSVSLQNEAAVINILIKSMNHMIQSRKVMLALKKPNRIIAELCSFHHAYCLLMPFNFVTTAKLFSPSLTAFIHIFSRHIYYFARKITPSDG